MLTQKMLSKGLFSPTQENLFNFMKPKFSQICFTILSCTCNTYYPLQTILSIALWENAALQLLWENFHFQGIEFCSLGFLEHLTQDKILQLTGKFPFLGHSFVPKGLLERLTQDKILQFACFLYSIGQHCYIYMILERGRKRDREIKTLMREEHHQ